VYLSVKGTSWCKNNELPWLTRRDPDDNHHSDGPSSSSSKLPPSSWIDPDMVVPPPGRVHQRVAGVTAADLRPTDTDRHRLRLTASGRCIKDKFDELDEEKMSPLSSSSQPGTVTLDQFTTSPAVCSRTFLTFHVFSIQMFCYFHYTLPYGMLMDKEVAKSMMSCVSVSGLTADKV